MDALFRAKPRTLSLKTHFEFVSFSNTSLPGKQNLLYRSNKSNRNQQMKRDEVACYT